MGYERSLVGSLPSTDVHMMKCELSDQMKNHKSSKKTPSLASMTNDNWESNHFAYRPFHANLNVASASVTAVNHYGTIFKSLTVDANFPVDLCASVCFMYSSPDLNTTCHFYLNENNNCYLGNAFHTNGDTLPATPTHLVYKMNQSKNLSVSKKLQSISGSTFSLCD